MNKQLDVQRFIKKHGSITKLQAARFLNEFNLGEIIARARRKGMDIETVMIPRENKQSYAKYTLVS